jgi:putative FmdB family regulatory protein
MPLYEYRCKACGHRFEKIQSFSAPDEKECPVCKGEVERLISAPAVHFSGSGFYSTDYPSKSSSAPKSEGGSKDGSAGSSEGSKDSSSGSSTDGGAKPSSGSESSSSAPATASTPASSGNAASSSSAKS